MGFSLVKEGRKCTFVLRAGVLGAAHGDTMRVAMTATRKKFLVTY
jgi:hypothetical protein